MSSVETEERNGLVYITKKDWKKERLHTVVEVKKNNVIIKREEKWENKSRAEADIEFMRDELKQEDDFFSNDEYEEAERLRIEEYYRKKKEEEEEEYWNSRSDDE